ncbi:acyl-CoA desaturase [Paraburkholderia jirisanensis]
MKNANHFLLANPRLEQLQIRNATLAIGLPFAATLLGVYLVIQGEYTALDMGLLAVMYVLSMIGVDIGFHRYFSHRSFRAHRSVELMLGILASMSAQGPLMYWVANHRRHHALSDQHGDAHSPYFSEKGAIDKIRGFIRSQVYWAITCKPTNPGLASDMSRSKNIRFINQHYLIWVLLGIIVPAAIEFVVYGTATAALHGALWGGLIRIFLGQQGYGTINSVCHMFGKRKYKIRDKSRNNQWLVFVTAGQSLHHNHHAYPRAALMNFDPYEVDPGAWIIVALERFGLVTDVCRVDREFLKTIEIHH